MPTGKHLTRDRIARIRQIARDNPGMSMPAIARRAGVGVWTVNKFLHDEDRRAQRECAELNARLDALEAARRRRREWCKDPHILHVFAKAAGVSGFRKGFGHYGVEKPGFSVESVMAGR